MPEIRLFDELFREKRLNSVMPKLHTPSRHSARLLLGPHDSRSCPINFRTATQKVKLQNNFGADLACLFPLGVSWVAQIAIGWNARVLYTLDI